MAEMTKVTNQQFAAMLRVLADLYEQNEDILQPGRYRPHDPSLEIYCGYISLEQVRALVRALACGGQVEKIAPPATESISNSFRLRIRLAGLLVDFLFPRDIVCKKVTKMVPTETWECPDSLLGLE